MGRFHRHDDGTVHEHATPRRATTAHDLGDHSGYATGTERIDVLERIFDENDRTARGQPRRPRRAGRVAVNVMSSPGAGKTALLRETLRRLGAELRIGVDRGRHRDQPGRRPAGRARRRRSSWSTPATASAASATSTRRWCARRWCGCRSTDSTSSSSRTSATWSARPSSTSARTARVMVSSVTEGEDKPLKYPVMFRSADLVLVNKIDLLPHLDFDLDLFARNLAAVNPAVRSDRPERAHRRRRRRVVRLAARRTGRARLDRFAGVTTEGELLWEPSADRIAAARLTEFAQWAGRARRPHVRRLRRAVALVGRRPGRVLGRVRRVVRAALADASPTAALGSRDMPGAQWFPGGTLNYAEHALYPPAGVDQDDVAVRVRPRGRAAPRRSPGASCARRSRRCGPRSSSTASASATGWPGSCPTRPRRSSRCSPPRRSARSWSSCSPDFGARGDRRPVHPDRAGRPVRRRRLPLRRQGVRHPRDRRGAARASCRRCAPPCSCPTSTTTPRCPTRCAGPTLLAAAGDARPSSRALRRPAVDPLLLRHDRAARSRSCTATAASCSSTPSSSPCTSTSARATGSSGSAPPAG